jgi:hypothetical protein
MLATMFNYSGMEPAVCQALYAGLCQNIAVGTEEVEGGRVFVKVVSPRLNGLTEREKQDLVWSALHNLGPNAQAVALALAFGTDEI